MNGGESDSNASSSAVSLTRRQALKLGGGGALGVGAGRVIYEYTGFGTVSGTNLVEQRLEPLARRRLRTFPFTLRLSDRQLALADGTIEFRDGTGESIAAVSIADADPNASDLEGPPAELAADLRAVEDDDFAFEFLERDAFFDRLENAPTRPFTVAALRGVRFREPSRETVRRFADVDPDDPAALVTGLAEGFGERTGFDFSRYVAGTLEKYLLFGTMPLKASFREPTHLDALLDDTAGLYCYEYALRSIEAFHAVPPHRQSPPVFGAVVLDDRHNHAYTGLASVVREDGELRIPMTFLDYLYSTAFDNFRLGWAFGEGIGAYNEFHRASDIYYWNPYVGG